MCSSLVARSEKHGRGVYKDVHTTMLTAVVGSVFLVFVGVAVSRPILRLMGIHRSVTPTCASTLWVRPGLLVYNFDAAVL